MRKRYIIMFVVGAVVLTATLSLGLPLGKSVFLGPVLLMGLAVQGAWSDHKRAERMGSIYTHQRLGSAKFSDKYHGPGWD
jgi:hypothetical protein